MKCAIVLLCLLVAVAASPVPQKATGESVAQSNQGQAPHVQVQQSSVRASVSTYL